MNFQEIIALMLIAAAAVYAVSIFLRKARAFSPMASCGNSCGCGSDTADKKIAKN